DPATAVVKVDMIEPLAKRVADLGWHVQFNVEGAQIVELADLLRRLPTPLVFDHLANPPLPAGIEHPSHAIVRGLIDRGRTWVKLSGAYSNSKIGPPSYPEATKTARAFVSAAPERLLALHLAPYTFRTNAGVNSFTVRTPHCIIATRVSVRKISRTFATPASPKAPSPHR